MLAIYASEKALRLAERLGETRAASRAHGIFGRVFGRIGDMTKARENLERAVELARGSDESETILALLALGQHLEVSEAAYQQAQSAYTDALTLAEEIGDVPSQVELHAALGWLALYRADWDAVRRSCEASARLTEQQGLAGKLCLSYVLRGLLRWRDGEWDEAERLYRRAHELAEQVGWSEAAFSSLFGLSIVLRDHGDFTGAATALGQALDVCERAGLIAQSIQALASRAEVYAMWGREEQGREAAEEAVELAERCRRTASRAATSRSSRRRARRGSRSAGRWTPRGCVCWPGAWRTTRAPSSPPRSSGRPPATSTRCPFRSSRSVRESCSRLGNTPTSTPSEEEACE
jgi:tetratricopeptide (TPR) repeat protein